MERTTFLERLIFLSYSDLSQLSSVHMVEELKYLEVGLELKVGHVVDAPFPGRTQIWVPGHISII